MDEESQQSTNLVPLDEAFPLRLLSNQLKVYGVTKEQVVIKKENLWGRPNYVTVLGTPAQKLQVERRNEFFRLKEILRSRPYAMPGRLRSKICKTNSHNNKEAAKKLKTLGL